MDHPKPFLTTHLAIPKDIATKRGKDAALQSSKLTSRSAAPSPRYLSKDRVTADDISDKTHTIALSLPDNIIIIIIIIIIISLMKS